MKDKPSEWIAISDLMSGVMAVVMLLLIVAVLQTSVSEYKYKEELAKAQAEKNESRNNPIIKLTTALKDMMKSGDSSELMTLDLLSNRLTLTDGVFERGSACLKLNVKYAVGTIQSKLVSFLKDNPNAQIFVEGYTDNIPVNRPVTDFQRFCTVYDDNYTLSAARAREVRKALIGDLDSILAKRIVVAGYGDSRPLDGVKPSDSKNRRVEVRFLLDDYDKGKIDIEQGGGAL